MPRDIPSSSSNRTDLFYTYLTYTGLTEPPTIYHRWSYISLLGAAIGRKAWFDLGKVGRVFPNIFIMLIGEPAARKSTAVKMAKRLFEGSGYSSFAADKTTKEKFLEDLEGKEFDDVDTQEFTRSSGGSGGSNGKGRSGSRAEKRTYDLTTSDNLWGPTESEESIFREPRETFIVADEFNDFTTPGNIEFFTTLGSFWDFDSQKPFSQRLKNSRSISIYQPTVSILAGNTPEGFSRCFPPEAIGNGFLSRLLLIHGEKSERDITFPEAADEKMEEYLVGNFRKILSQEIGRIEGTPEARELLDKIYKNKNPVPDARFKGYNNRRFIQLLKLCIIFAVGKFQSSIEYDDVLLANTILSHAELLMPKAMGEFGKARNSDVANKIMLYIENSTRPVSQKELWKQVVQDLGNQRDMMEIIQGLIAADKIQSVIGVHNGFLPKKSPRKEIEFVDWNFLTQEERDMI